MKSVALRLSSSLLFTFFLLTAMGQSPLIVNMQVLPPYSPVVADYMSFDGTSIITVTNTTATAYDIKLAVHITGDNGIEAYTNPGFTPSLPITVAPFATRTIYGSELQSYNDVSYTLIGADAQNIALTGIIPDGFYTLCVQALDYVTNAELSAAEPLGCIPLYIQYLDAPLLISPFCDEPVNQTFPQNVIFNWITPAGAPLTTQYSFRLIEVIPFDRNPYDAMAASTTPVFFESTTNLPLFIYGPGQPPLEPGHTYAWQVTAFDPATQVFFQNEGKSQVCSFKYEPNLITYISDTTKILINFTGDTMRVNGNLQYYYASEGLEEGSGLVEGTIASAVNYPFGNEPIRLVTKYMLKYNGGADSIYLPYNTTGYEMFDNDQVISSTTTSANGDFSFLFMSNQFPETGLIQSGVTVNIPDNNLIDHYFNVAENSDGFDLDIDDFEFWGGFGDEPDNGFTLDNANDYDYTAGNNFEFNSGGVINGGAINNGNNFNPDNVNLVNYSGGSNNDFNGSFTGDLYKTVQIFVNNAYYCMPDNSFRNLSDSTTNYVGTVTSKVRDYVLNVTLNNVNDEGEITNYINNDATPINNPNPGITLELDGGFDADKFVIEPEYFYYYPSAEDDDDEYVSQFPWDFEEADGLTYNMEGALYRYSVYREQTPAGLPKHEGMDMADDNLMNLETGDPIMEFEFTQLGLKDYGAGRDLIARVESATGSATFNKLIKSLDPEDYYILVIEPIDNIYLSPVVEIKFRYEYDDYGNTDAAIYGSQYQTPTIGLEETENSTITSTAVITGNINYKFDDPNVTESFPLKNVTVTLQRLQYVITEEGEKKYSRVKTDLITVDTDNQGNYLFSYTDTAAYGLIAMYGTIFGEDNCVYDIPEEENFDIPGMDQINPGNFNPGGFNLEIDNKLHFKSPEDDIFEYYAPVKYGKSYSKRIHLLEPAPVDAMNAPCPYSGKLYQELAIKIESPYYTSPATHFTITPAQYKEVPDLTCYVKSYDLTINVNADPNIPVQYKIPGSDLRDMMVVLIRKNKPADVPEMEGIAGGLDNAAVAKFITNAASLEKFAGITMNVNIDAPDALGGMEYYNPFELFTYGETTTINQSEIIGCALVDLNGNVTFKNLVKNVAVGDYYNILAIPDYENSDINYIIPEHIFETDFNINTSTNPYGPLTVNTTETTATEGFYPKMKVSYSLNAAPQNPIIFGKVLRSDNGYPLMDVDVELLDNPGEYLEIETTTASDGSYALVLTAEQYNSNSVAQFTRQLKFSKYGYEDTKTAYPLYLKKGKILNRVADTLQPAVLVTGYIYTEWYDEESSSYPGAPAYVQIGNGPQVHTECQEKDFMLDEGILNGYLDMQEGIDIYELVPNYEEMWEQNLWDPSTQVFQFNNDNVLGGINMNIETTFDIGGKTTTTTNRMLNPEGSGDKTIGAGGDYVVVNDDETTVKSGTFGTPKTTGGIGLGTTTDNEIGGMGLFEMDENTCELAFFATYASRGTWLAEINPDSSKYITRFENVYVPDTGDVLRVDFIVYQKLHRMRFNITDANGVDVNANIEIVGITDVLSTGADGSRDILFENGGNTFNVIVSGPEGSSYVREELTIVNNASEFYQTYDIVLEKGVSITGKVTSNGANLSGARVFVDAAGLEHLEAITSNTGTYTINGVPKLSGVTVRAVKEGSGLIGDSDWVTTNTGALTYYNINFELTVYDDLDLSKLLGFETEIEYLSNYGGETKISGSLINITGNSKFDVAEEVRLPFNYVKVKASKTTNAEGIPLAEPVDASFTISNNDAIPLTVFDIYKAEAGITASTIVVEKVNATSGKIKSPVKILETSFSDPAFNFSGFGVTGFYLKNKTIAGGEFGGMYEIGTHESIVLFTTGSATMPTGDYYEIDANGSNLLFNVQNVAAYIKSSSNNRVYADSVVLDTWLDPYIANTEGFKAALNIGKIHVTPTSISNKSGITPFTIEMEDWDLICNSWALNSTGFHMYTGTLDASGVSFGFNNIKIESGELVYATSTTLGKSNVSLIDILTLAIENDPDLIYNGSNWQIYVGGTLENPAASIANLPGLPAANNDLSLQILLFYSNADAEFKMNNNTFDLYSVTSFTTEEGALYVHKDEASGESYLTLPGIIDLNLPAISVQPTAFLIKNNNGSIATELEPFGFGMEVNGIVADFNAGDIEFLPNGLIVAGSVSEAPYFDHQVKLYHLTDSTAINTLDNQVFQYTNSGQKLDNLFGRMYPQTNSWTAYQFTGDVVGANKVGGRWTFTVYGEITAENQKVDVDDLKMSGADKSMDFDNMGMSFDFPNRRLVGSISIDESMPGGGQIKGQANIVYDDEGWYFVCGGLISMPGNPYVSEVSLALLFGDYPIANEQVIKDIFTEYAFDGKLPDAFANNISGFYFDGKIEMPIPYVPNFEIDFVVVSVEFEATITAGFQLGMNFTEAMNTYYTGLDATIQIHAGVGASVVFGCAGVSLDYGVGISLTGQYSSNGEWFAVGTFDASFAASAYAGVGLACDSECEGACEKEEWSGEVGVTLKGEMGYEDGDDFSDVGIEEVYFK